MFSRPSLRLHRKPSIRIEPIRSTTPWLELLTVGASWAFVTALLVLGLWILSAAVWASSTW